MERTSLAAILVVCACVMSACAGRQDVVRWVKGPMPAEGNFDGVYQSDFGRMELTVSGNRVTGLYESDQFWGRINGEVEKNLLRFNWHQFNEEMRGKIRETDGEGIFQYIVEDVPMGAKTKKYHRLEGWWGYQGSDLVNRWNAAKLSSRAKKKLQPHGEERPEAGEQKQYDQSVGFTGESGEGAAEENSSEDAEEEEESGGADIF